MSEKVTVTNEDTFTVVLYNIIYNYNTFSVIADRKRTLSGDVKICRFFFVFWQQYTNVFFS